MRVGLGVGREDRVATAVHAQRRDWSAEASSPPRPSTLSSHELHTVRGVRGLTRAAASEGACAVDGSHPGCGCTHRLACRCIPSQSRDRTC